MRVHTRAEGLIMSSHASAKGPRLELVVLNAALIMRDRGDLLSVIHSPQGQHLDSKGIDLLLQLPSGFFVAVQCKADVRDVTAHLHKHQNIPYVLVMERSSRRKRDYWRQLTKQGHPLLEPGDPKILRPYVMIVWYAVPDKRWRRIANDPRQQGRRRHYLKVLNATIKELSFFLEHVVPKAMPPQS